MYGTLVPYGRRLVTGKCFIHIYIKDIAPLIPYAHKERVCHTYHLNSNLSFMLLKLLIVFTSIWLLKYINMITIKVLIGVKMIQISLQHIYESSHALANFSHNLF